MPVGAIHGRAVASERTWTGTNTGPFVLWDGSDVLRTGRRLEFRGMEMVGVRGGKIVEYHMYWDSAAIARQLGFARGDSV